MAKVNGKPVGEPWSRWNSGQASQPGKRFTVTGGKVKDQRRDKGPDAKKK